MSRPRRTYPLVVENIGDDDYRLMSRGHHDAHDFMRAARGEGFAWPLGMPRHLWFRAVPDRTGHYACRYVEAGAGDRGAFPVTYAAEAYGDHRYEVLIAARDVAPA